MADPAFAEEYNALDAQYAFARAIISARIQAGMTHAELTQRMGTLQVNISKREHSTLNPSFNLARRVAEGMGKHFTVSI